MINKIIAIIFVGIFIFPKVSRSQEQQFDYENLTAGTCVTTNGFFFTEEGMVRLIVNTKEKIKLSTLDSQKQIDLLKVDLKTCSSSKEIQLKIQKDMYEKQLAIKQLTINSYIDKEYWNTIKSASGIVAGIFTGIIIGKYLIK